MVSPCGFESHLSHQNSGYPYGVTGIFYASMGLEEGGLAIGKVKKCPVDIFLARGRVLHISDASGTDVDEI